MVFAIHSHESAMGAHMFPSWPSLLLPFPSHPSGSSQCTSPEHLVSCIKPVLAIYFTYDNICVSMLFSQIIPPFPSATVSKTCSLHLCLFCCLAYRAIITIFLKYIYMHYYTVLAYMKWQPTPVFLPGESQGLGNLVGCHLWGCTELDTTDATYQLQQHTVLVFFFVAYFTLYNRLQFHPSH